VVAPGQRARLLAGSLVAAAALVPLAAAVTPPKGDQAAISFFGQQFKAYLPVAGVKIVETGYFSLQPAGGTSVNFRWSVTTPKGYTPAKAEVLAWLSSGRITAYLATLTAPKIRQVRILMSGAKVFVASTRCWRKAPISSSPFGLGDNFVLNNGGTTFRPLTRTDTSTVASYSYRWGPGALAAEADTFSNSNPPAISTEIKVTGTQTLTVHKTITPLAEAPELPVQAPPAQPRPKPLCK
jgi:hypothetical protein